MRFMQYYKQSLGLGFVRYQFLITKIMAHFEKLRLQSFTTQETTLNTTQDHRTWH